MLKKSSFFLKRKPSLNKSKDLKIKLEDIKSDENY